MGDDSNSFMTNNIHSNTHQRYNDHAVGEVADNVGRRQLQCFNMKDGESTFMPYSNSDILQSNVNYSEEEDDNINYQAEEEEEAAEAARRQLELEEDYKELDYITIEEDEDNSDEDENVDNHDIDRDDGVSGSHSFEQDHQFTVSALESHKKSSEHNETSSSTSDADHVEKQSLPCEEENSDLSVTDDYRIHNNHNDSKHSSENACFYITENYQHQVQPNEEFNSRTDINASSEKISKYETDLFQNFATKNTSNSPSAMHESNQQIVWKDEYEKIRLLYDTLSKEFGDVRKREILSKEKYEQDINILRSQLIDVKELKNKLASAQQQSSEFKHENIELKGRLSAMEHKLSAEEKAKQSALGELQSSEFTINLLEKQISKLTLSDNAIRLQNQNERVIKDLKLRHQKEILQLKEENDKLLKNLNDKINECDNVTFNLSQLEEKYQKYCSEKTNIINKLNADLEASQRKYQSLIDSGDISEVGDLKLQLQHLQKEKNNVLKDNFALKDKIKSLELELRTSESLKNLASENSIEINKHEINKRGQNYQTELNLRQKLEISEKNVLVLNQQNRFLKEELDSVQKRISHWEERARSFESFFNESEKKAKELQTKLEEIMPVDSVPKFQYEKDINVLKNQLMDIEKKYRDIKDRFKVLSSYEKKLIEKNRNLENRISDMLQEHASEKIKAVEECREQCLELHNTAIQKLKDELSTKSDVELKNVCTNYENKIVELQKDLKRLNGSLYDAQQQCVLLFEENKSLQSQLDSIAKSKERIEIEKEIKLEYEKHLEKMKLEIHKHAKDHYETSVKQEIKNFQEEWTKQKLEEVKAFENDLKQQLDEQYNKCLNEEQSKLAIERQKVIQDYEGRESALKLYFETEMQKLAKKHQEEINSLQHSETEKENSNIKQLKSFQTKFHNEIKEIQQNHQHEIQSIRHQYKEKMATLENEIESLKTNFLKKSEEKQEMYIEKEISDQKQKWEKEKCEFINNESTLKAKLKSALESETKHHDKVKKYQKYITSFEKKQQEKVEHLKSQNIQLQKLKEDTENKLFSLQELHKQTVFELEQKEKISIRKNIGNQTEGIVISRNTLLEVENLCMQCLRNISEEIKIYLLNSRKRIPMNLITYHEQFIKHVQNVLKTVPFNHNLCMPRLNMNSHTSVTSSRNHILPNIRQKHFNQRLCDLTPTETGRSGDVHKGQETTKIKENNAKAFHFVKSSSDSAIPLEDISFDFVPIKTFNPTLVSTKMPEYANSRGLFNHEESVKRKIFQS